MTETVRISFDGSGPFIRTLVQALEDEGVTVAVQREGPYVGQHRGSRGMGESVRASLLATGGIDAIHAGVSTFQSRFADRAVIGMTPQPAAPPVQGRHRA